MTFPDRYSSPRRIGHGGMGEIYLAEDTSLGRQVAIKLLDERFAQDEQVRARFRREALTAAKLSGHPNIVTIFDVGEAEGRPFIVMEYLAGGTIGDRRRPQGVGLDSAEALGWLAQTAAGLDEAHAAGVVHRDIKPANLLLDERGNVHVADFGIARVADETMGGMTVTGTILGTSGYLSPEQARGEPATAASDVYALGIVAYELMTGGRPFEGSSPTAEAAAHLNQPVPYASERGVGLPREVDGVFARVLAKQPGARYATATEFVDELRRALEPRHEPISPPSARPSAVRESGSRYVPALLALLVAALAAGGVAAVVLSDDDEPERRSQPTQADEPRTGTGTTGGAGEGATTQEETQTSEEPSGGGTPISYDEAVALTDEATGLMRQGDFRGALKLARRAYSALLGSGELYEAYAAYNAGRSWIELGKCRQGLPLLAASESIQGGRSEIDDARAQCSSDGDGDEGDD